MSEPCFVCPNVKCRLYAYAIPVRKSSQVRTVKGQPVAPSCQFCGMERVVQIATPTRWAREQETVEVPA